MSEHITPMSTDRLEGIAAVAAAAPDGPWDYYNGTATDGYVDIVAGYRPTGVGAYTFRRRIAHLEVEDYWGDPDNLDAAEDEEAVDEDAADQAALDLAHFIATSRSAVPELVTEVKRLRAEIADLRRERDNARHLSAALENGVRQAEHEVDHLRATLARVGDAIEGGVSHD